MEQLGGHAAGIGAPEQTLDPPRVGPGSIFGDRDAARIQPGGELLQARR